jgi:hypothetical protein
MRNLDNLNLGVGKKFTFIDKSDVVGNVIIDPVGLALTIQLEFDNFSSMPVASLSIAMFFVLCFFATK